MLLWLLYKLHILFATYRAVSRTTALLKSIENCRGAPLTQAWVMYLPCHIYHQTELGKSHPLSHK